MERHTDNEIRHALKHSGRNDKETELRTLIKTLESMNDKLRESESIKTHFLSNIRNEINNPLSSIMGLSQLIIEGSHLTFDVIQQAATTIYSESFDLDFQLRNIFVAAELEAGDYIPSISYMDAQSLILSIVSSWKHKAERKNITIAHSYQSIYETEKERYFKSDPEKLKLILSNLLSNAIEFSLNGGRVELAAKRDVLNLVLSLRDYGIGFDKEDQKKIFERFRQLDSGLTRKHGGQGLGLSITKDLVELFGGTISVTSYKGQGSIFTVSIPESQTSETIDTFSDDGNVFVF
jgi:signal transduction histidine kinase